MKIRERLWEIIVAKHPEGVILPWWLMAVKAVLYPMDFIYWKLSRSRGYQFETDIWKIEGMCFTGGAMRALARSQGEIYKITRIGECVTLERVDTTTPKKA